jgi:hypothetical protein
MERDVRDRVPFYFPIFCRDRENDFLILKQRGKCLEETTDESTTENRKMGY